MPVRRSSLLFLRDKLRRRTVKLVLDGERHAFSVSRNRHACDADYFPVAFIGFIDRARPCFLHRNAGRAWIAIVGRFCPVELRRVALSCLIGHRQAIT
jgi:hypothetical protein